MRGRLLLAGFGVLTSLSPAFAQFPPPTRTLPPYQPLTPPVQFPRLPDPPKPTQPTTPGANPPGSPVIPAGGSVPVNPSGYPAVPGEPRMLPPGVLPSGPVVPPAVPQPNAAAPTQPGFADGSTVPPGQTDTPLPYPEQKAPLDAGSVTVRRLTGGWQVCAGPRVFKDFGDNEANAREVARVLRELRPTEWVAIGSPRPVVEYGLINGRPPITAAFPRTVVPIDLRTVRVEPVKGVWCVRDDGSILFNFGARKADADQALAVVRRYGFNRVGMVGGSVAAPAMTYLYASLEADGAERAAVNPLVAAAQENGLTRTGIPVPGVGYVGEMVRIDPRKVEARREGSEWVVAFGPDVLGRFGPWEWAARDAIRVMQDCRFTEFCTVGSAGVTFFLSSGKAPTRVPFSAQARAFDPDALKAQQYGQKWAVTEGGRHLFDVSGPDEGEALIRLLRHFRFDQVCHLGQPPRAGMVFLAKGR